MKTTKTSSELLHKTDGYWLAAHYLSVSRNYPDGDPLRSTDRLPESEAVILAASKRQCW